MDLTGLLRPSHGRMPLSINMQIVNMIRMAIVLNTLYIQKKEPISSWSQVAVLEFSTFKNFYRAINIPPLNSINETFAMFVSTNNITKISVRYPSLGQPLSDFYNYSKFNDHGYPTNYTISDSLNHVTDVRSIDYICQ